MNIQKDFVFSAIEKYDKRDYIEELSGEDVSFYLGEQNAVWCFSNIKYNQKLVDKYSCTWQAACGVISDVTWFALPLDFRKDVWAAQLLTTAKPWVWDYLQNWIKQAVKLFNEQFPELPYKLEYYRVDDVRSDKILKILSTSSILTWYKWSLYSDAQDNWIIDNNDNKNWSWHAIRIVKAWKEWFNICVKYVDNYEWLNKFNVIEVPDLTNNKDFFKWGYYLKKVMK